MLGYLSHRRRRLARSDTDPCVCGTPTDCRRACRTPTESTRPYGTPTANQIAPVATIVTELINQPSATCNERPSRLSDSRPQGHLTPRRRRGPSPPGTIRDRIRHRSPSEHIVRKFSDHSTKSKRSRSIDAAQQLSVVFLLSQMTDTNAGRLSRTYSRSGSAKNLLETRDESTVVKAEARPCQKERAAIFRAVEDNDLKATEMLLASQPDVVHSVSDIDLTPLDLAMLKGHSTVAKRLIQAGGRNSEFVEKDYRQLPGHLAHLGQECAAQLQERGSRGALPRELEALEDRRRELRLLLTSLDRMRPGPAPRKVALEVSGLFSLLVTVHPPSDSVASRYKIEWSRQPDFQEVDDEIVVRTKFPTGTYELCDLVPHVAHFVRVSGINLRGMGPPVASVPSSAAPSSWLEAVPTDLEAPRSRRGPRPHEWPQPLFREEETEVEQQLQFWLASLRSVRGPPGQDPGETRRHLPGRKALLRALFASAVKFSRQPKHGLYLALVYFAADGEKVLACGEEQLPFVQVDDEQPTAASVNGDCIWLMRLLANGPDLRLLVDVLGRLQLPAGVQLRAKLLVTVSQLQAALGTPELGLLNPVPVREADFTVLVLARQVPLARQLSLPPGLKWAPLSKVGKAEGALLDQGSAHSGLEKDLYSRIESLISFSLQSRGPLEDGLYLGYLRLKSTLDQLYIQQHISSPSMFPVARVRDNRHVDEEEWAHLVALGGQPGPAAAPANAKGPRLQGAVLRAWRQLQGDLKLTPRQALGCRLYLEEILWLRRRVSVILVVPSAEEFCGLPGEDLPLPADFQWMSLHSFEFLHFLATEDQFGVWAGLSSVLEVLLPVAQHCLRQGFDQPEVDLGKERLERLQAVHGRLDRYWKSLRWSVDVVNNCRDKQLSGLLTLPIKVLEESNLLAGYPLSAEVHCPAVKAASHRRRPQVGPSPPGSLQSSPSQAPSSAGSSSPQSQHQCLTTSRSSLDPYRPLKKADLHKAESPPQREEEVPASKQPRKGTIRVYAGYPCGLHEGTSVKILLNHHTTTADVIRLIVMQLNATSRQTNPQSPQYRDEDLPNFYLTVTIGDRSWPLPDNFHPLRLNPPWRTGKLTVTLKDRPLTFP